MVESLATLNWGIGGPELWRKATILADATLEILKKEPSELTGQALLDEPFLRQCGVTDFEQYNCVPGANPPPIDSFWVKQR